MAPAQHLISSADASIDAAREAVTPNDVANDSADRAAGAMSPINLQLTKRAQAVLQEWASLADCTLLANDGMRFSVSKIYVARHSRVLAKVITEFPDNATLDLDDEPAAVAAFVLWAYDASLPCEVFDSVTPVPALLLRFAAKWDMPQLRSFCEGVIALWQVTMENHDYCTALAEEHSLGSLQTACSGFREAQRRSTAREAGGAGRTWHQPFFGCCATRDAAVSSCASLATLPCLLTSMQREVYETQPNLLADVAVLVCCCIFPGASAVALEDLRWNARINFQLHSMFGQPPPAYYMTSGCDNNDDECGLAVFCQPCAFLQLAAEWKFQHTREDAAAALVGAPDVPPPQQEMDARLA